MEAPKPLGYWLKHLHNLLEEYFERDLADLGLTRRQWQILNTLSRGERTADDLREALAPFWTPGEPDFETALGEATHRGWTTPGRAGATIALSEAGRATHARMAERVARTRETVMSGLAPERYAAVVDTLATMATNVETALAAPAGRSGAGDGRS